MTDEIMEMVNKIHKEYSIYMENSCYYADNMNIEEAQEILKDALVELTEILLKVNRKGDLL